MNSGPLDDHYLLFHHHVQLALKYSRLENPTREQTEYLQQLLAPHTRAEFRINPDDVRGNLLSASYTVTPKIIKGRYVRKCTWEFSPWREYISLDNLGAIALCCHLVTVPILRLESGQIIRWDHWSPLTQALSFAFEKRAVIGRCHFCHLDFKVTSALQGTGLVIEAWQDLGPEGSIN